MLTSIRWIPLSLLLHACGGGGGGSHSEPDAAVPDAGGRCGDGQVDPGEECDEGAGNADTAACRPGCVAAACGDGFVGPEETCDDANDVDTDACLSTCVDASCGDAFLEIDVEVCDDGGTTDGDGCSAACDSTLVWSQVIDGPGAGNDWGHGVATDADGAIVVAGAVTGATTGVDVWARKLDVAGGELWTRTYDEPGFSGDFGQDAAVGPSGAVAIFGHVDTSIDRDYDAWLRRFDGDGNEIYTVRYDGDTSDDDIARGVAFGSDGSVVFVGYELSYSGDLAYVRRLDTAGSETWTERRFDARPEDVAIDADGNVFVAGSTGTDAWLWKLDPLGNEIWSREYGGAGPGSDAAQGVAMAADGGVFLVGYQDTGEDLGPRRATWIARLDSDGEEIWSDLGAASRIDDQIDRGVAVDADGNVIAVASEPGADGTDVAWLRKWTGDGSVVWTQHFDEPGSRGDFGLDVATDPDDFVAVTGYVRRTSNDVWIARFAP